MSPKVEVGLLFCFSCKLKLFFLLFMLMIYSPFFCRTSLPHWTKDEDLIILIIRLAAEVVGTFWFPPLSGMQSSCSESGAESRAERQTPPGLPEYAGGRGGSSLNCEAHGKACDLKEWAAAEPGFHTESRRFISEEAFYFLKEERCIFLAPV